MSLDTNAGRVPANATASAQSAASTDTPNILELLDAMGLEFVMHTHHPLTHIEVESEAPAGTGEANVRLECSDPPPMAVPSGSWFNS
jgi:hypothetical protein